jgi:hypothetical protein
MSQVHNVTHVPVHSPLSVLSTCVAKQTGDMVTAQRDGYDTSHLGTYDVKEAIYFVGLTDSDKGLLNGDNAYEIRFPADALPSSEVNAFWSMTLYSVPDYRVVDNPMKRYNLSSQSPLKKNADGSLSVWVGSTMPKGALASNWLPSPAGKGFALTLRMYVSKDDVLDGKWFPPAIKHVP